MLPRIIAIDYGKKRCGIAKTDPMGWFAQAVGTFPPQEIFLLLKEIEQTEGLQKIIVGMPYLADGSIGETGLAVQDFANELQKQHPTISIEFMDERYSSQNAMQALIESGVKKNKRKEKGMLDKTTAVLLLQMYLMEQS